MSANRYKSLKCWKIGDINLTQQFNLSISTNFHYQSIKITWVLSIFIDWLLRDIWIENNQLNLIFIWLLTNKKFLRLNQYLDDVFSITLSSWLIFVLGCWNVTSNETNARKKSLANVFFFWHSFRLRLHSNNPPQKLTKI